MNKRRQYIVDKKFQLKTAFTVIGIVSILTAVIIIAISSSVVYNNNRIHNIIKGEDKIFQALSVMSSSAVKDPAYRSTIKQMSRDHVANVNMTDGIINNNKTLMIALLIFIVVQGIVLYILMIKKTHKISGPIYVMSNYIKEMIDGKYPVPRPLRKHDELIEFYELFRQLAAAIKERETSKPQAGNVTKSKSKKR